MFHVAHLETIFAELGQKVHLNWERYQFKLSYFTMTHAKVSTNLKQT